MNKATKAWYKEAKAKCQKLSNDLESNEFIEQSDVDYYYEQMAEIAEYYILACDFDLPSFDCNEEG